MRKIIFSLFVSVLLVGFMSCDPLFISESLTASQFSETEITEAFAVATISTQNSMGVWYDNWYATDQEVTVNLYEANGSEFNTTLDHINGINPDMVNCFIVTRLVLDGEGNPWALQHEGTVTFVTSTFTTINVQLDVLWIGETSAVSTVFTINGVDYTAEYYAFMAEYLF